MRTRHVRGSVQTKDNGKRVQTHWQCCIASLPCVTSLWDGITSSLFAIVE